MSFSAIVWTCTGLCQENLVRARIIILIVGIVRQFEEEKQQEIEDKHRQLQVISNITLLFYTVTRKMIRTPGQDFFFPLVLHYKQLLTSFHQ